MGRDTRSLRLFLTAEHRCNYLSGKVARNLVADPSAVDNRLYGALAHSGFRRSGDHIYRPHCSECEACESIRVNVAAFRPDRSQRRAWMRNRDLDTCMMEPHFDIAHYRLFRRYLQARHREGGMDDTTPEHYLSFITSPWSDTNICQFSVNGRVIAVAVIDRLTDALSAVYTFFEPDEVRRSLGTYAILWQINEARRLNLSWLYLGYAIEGCRKMSYKTAFNPHQARVAGHWTGNDR